MARITDYRPNSVGLKPLLLSDELGDLCVERAEVGAAYARGRAVRATGAHADSIHVERVTGAGAKGDRVGAEIVADSPHSAPAEFGRRGRGGDHALRSAIPIIEHG